MLQPEQVENVVTVGFEFTWVNADNPEERIVKHIYLQDIAADPKKIGGLLTYAHRYHLMKTFQIATDDLDIDAYQTQILAGSKTTKPRITQDQISELEQKLIGNERLRNQVLNQIPGKTLENLTIDRYQPLMQWITTNEEKI
ncbi:MAG: hypothetical protein GKC08_03005 [Methanosarcinales archaeon]|nr:hypothetical protein [Methanosarcinales archaeon]